MASKIIIANWKMNPQTYAEAENLISEISNYLENKKQKEVVICPPFVWLTDLSHKYADKIAFGAQDVFSQNEGSYTGEISPLMLKNSRVKYAIIGHSERREHLGETDAMINQKIRAALENGLKTILCVGEPTRKNEKADEAKEYIKKQLEKDLKGIRNWKLEIGNLFIAYEPIWAIGTGTPDKPEDAVEMIKFIKGTLIAKPYTLNPKIIYGGSAESSNLKNFIKHKEIDGALIGQASLNAEEFIKILQIADELS
mgnify:CR=1 FL=1